MSSKIPKDLEPHVFDEELESARKQLPGKGVVSVLKLSATPINLKENGRTAWRIPESNGGTRGTMDIESEGSGDLLGCLMSLCVICGPNKADMVSFNPATDRVILSMSGITPVLQKEKDGELKVVMEEEIPWDRVESIHVTDTQLYVLLFNRDALTNMWGQQDFISRNWAFPNPKAAAKLFVALRKKDYMDKNAK